MAIFRVEKSKDYTVVSNYHIRDKSISLKAKGLLTQMLSLPEEWDYTLTGLAEINLESVDAIRTAVQELEKAGYIQRRQTQDSKGKFASNEYVIHEKPVLDQPLLDFPTTDNPSTEKPLSENPTQLNKDISSKDINKKKIKKEKAKGDTELLSEPELRDIVVESVRQIAGPEWTRENKNELYALVVELYNPKRAVQKNHPMRTKRSISRLFGNLTKMAGSNYQVMHDMLDKAIANGWQSVEQPKYATQKFGGRSDLIQPNPRDEVQYRCV